MCVWCTMHWTFPCAFFICFPCAFFIRFIPYMFSQLPHMLSLLHFCHLLMGTAADAGGGAGPPACQTAACLHTSGDGLQERPARVVPWQQRVIAWRAALERLAGETSNRCLAAFLLMDAAWHAAMPPWHSTTWQAWTDKVSVWFWCGLCAA